MSRHWLLRLLPVVASLIFVNAEAQVNLPGVAEKGSEQPSTELSVSEQKSRIEASLAEIERQRNEIINTLPEAGVETAGTSPDKRRLLDRLLVLQEERLKRLNKIEANDTKDVVPALNNPLVKEFDSPPPYSALHIDTLRDELDDLRDRYQVLVAGLAMRETEKQTRKEQLQRMAESLRLANDKVSQARDGASLELARQHLELASLRKQVAEAELSAVALDQESLRQQSASLKNRIEAMNTLVTRVLPYQRLSESELDVQRGRVRTQQRDLEAEIDRLTANNLRHTRERKALLAKGNAITEKNQQSLAFFDRALEIDAETLQGLKGLQLLLDATRDAWESRYAAMSAESTQARQKAVFTLKKFHDNLTSRKRLLREMRDTKRAAIREQESRLANLAQDVDAVKQEQQILLLLQKQASVYERLELNASRFERQLSRWTSDLGIDGGDSFAIRASSFVSLIKQGLVTGWNYELFTVEDISEVDGRPVTISYGVTVGKSVGALALFAIGYWLFSMLAGVLEKLLVRHFRVDPQVAKVIRRWVLITFAALLVVFVLNLARIPLTVFAFMGGALAIGVGFGTQTIIKNFISGIIILFERKIRVGDIIESGGMTGQVTAVDLRATTVRGFDGVEALVPNSSFLENQVINWTYSNQQIRREIKVGIAYGSDTRQASDVFLEVAGANSEVLNTPAPEVFFEDFGDSALSLALVYWVELGPGKTARKIDSELRHSIYQALASAGISIPFPQSDVHFDIDRPLPVTFINTNSHMVG